MKVKKFIIILLLIILNFSTISVAQNEDPDAWDYTWLDEAIKEAEKSKEPSILSRYAVIYDRTSNQVLWGKAENTSVPMASTTKIMTAIVMLEQIGTDRLKEEITVDREAANTVGSRLGLSTGDKITYNDLLYGLMLCSGNDAAVQIAISTAGSVENFAELMNKKALELGLKNTHFITPHGLDREEHYTTALELAIITDYALENPKIREVVSTKQYTVKIDGYSKTISNTNELLGYLNGVIGVKTGYTSKAGRCLVTATNRDGFEIITVVLGADTRKIRTQDSTKLIEYTYNNYKLINLEELVQTEYQNWCRINERRINVYKGIKKRPEINKEEGTYKLYPLKNDDIIEIETEAHLKFEAPLFQNTEVGKLIIKNGDTVIDEVSIKTTESIEKKNVFVYLVEMMQIFKLAM